MSFTRGVTADDMIKITCDQIVLNDQNIPWFKDITFL